MIEREASHEQLEETIHQLDTADKVYLKQVQKIETVMKKTLKSWKQLKAIRRETGMETVPYRLIAKEYEVDGRKSFDFGIMQTDSTN